MLKSKSKSTWALRATAVVGLAVVGCQEPEGIGPAAPPGIDSRSLVEIKEADEPQALGESAGQAAPKIKPKAADIPPAPPTAKGEVKTTESGVKYETVKEGTGAEARSGQRATLHYVGTLDDGRKFDSSRDKGQPFTFAIGAGDVIKGWDEAVPGMKVGEVRKLTIPPSAGYGALGKGAIPPNATLHFEVELMSVH